MNELPPEGFYIPRFYVDQLMYLLTPAEFKVLLYALRHLIGFGKVTDQIAHSQFVSGIVRKSGKQQDHGTGLSNTKVTNALKELQRFNVLLLINEAEYKPPTVKRAAEYALQPEISLISWEALRERAIEKREKGRERVATADAIRKLKAQEKRREKELKKPQVRFVSRNACGECVPTIGSTDV